MQPTSNYSDHVKIPLGRKEAWATVDPEDIDLASMRWHLFPGRKVYARRRIGNKGVLMHRIVLERKLGRPLSANEHVDHINGGGVLGGNNATP